MKTLSAERRRAAQEFIKEGARPLELACYEHAFEDGPVEAVWREVAKFANVDGGFGHGIEPDFRLPASSPMATTVAFQHLTRTGATAENPLVKEGVRFLQHSYDEQDEGWFQTPAAVNAYPRAVWWNYDPQRARDYLHMHWANPSAEIVGYLHAYRDLVEPALLERVTAKAMDVLLTSPDQVRGHEFLCYSRMVSFVPEKLQSQAIPALCEIAPGRISTVRDEWSDYSIQPLMAVESPDSPFCECLREAVDKNLDYLIETQDDDGSWYPNWFWGQFPKDWQKAQVEWQGVLSLTALLRLQAFGRLAA